MTSERLHYFDGKHYRNVPVPGKPGWTTSEVVPDPTREQVLETALVEALKVVDLLYRGLEYVHENRELLGNWDHYRNYTAEVDSTCARLGITL